MKAAFKENRVFIIVLIILGFSGYNSIRNQNEMHNHQVSFDKINTFTTRMNAFAGAGGRFTAQDGEKKLDKADALNLCDAINELKFHYTNLDMMDCDKFEPIIVNKGG